MRWAGLLMLIAGAFSFAISVTAATANWTAFYVGLALLVAGGAVLAIGVIRHRGQSRRGHGHGFAGPHPVERSLAKPELTHRDDLLQRFRTAAPSTADAREVTPEPPE